MTLPLLPNPKQQYFDANGNPLAGGKLYTYAAGTTTPKATYQDAAGTTPNANPIILDSLGQAVIFWNGSYKVKLNTPADALVWTVDNITTPDVGLRTDLASNAGGMGSKLVAFVPSVSGAVARVVESKLQDTASIADFGASTDISDNSAAINIAMAWLFGANDRTLVFPYGVYTCTASVGAIIGGGVNRVNCSIIGNGSTLSFGIGSAYQFKIEATGTGLLRKLYIGDLRTIGGTDAFCLRALNSTNYIYDALIRHVTAEQSYGTGILIDGNVFESTIVQPSGTTGTVNYASFTGAVTIAGQLIVSTIPTIPLEIGMYVSLPAGAKITGIISGSLSGTCTVSISDTTSTFAAAAVVATHTAYCMRFSRPSGGGLPSSLAVIGGSLRGGINCVFQDIGVYDVTYTGNLTALSALQEGVYIPGAIGTTIDSMHVEGNWTSAADIASAGAGLRFAGTGLIKGVTGVCNASQKQKYAIRVFAGSGGVAVQSGAGFMTAPGKYASYQTAAGSGELTLYGRAALDYDFLGGTMPVHIGRHITPVQIGHRVYSQAYSASRTLDMSQGSHHVVGALTGNVTLQNPTNRATDPSGLAAAFSTEIVVTLVQDATGGRTVTWDTDFAAGMTAIVGTASTYSIWTFRWINSKWRQVSFASGL